LVFSIDDVFSLQPSGWAVALAPFFFGLESKLEVSGKSSRGRQAVGKKLYCGNLSYSVRGPELETLFSAFGTVESAQVIEDRESGRSKGFGFVEMSSDEEAAAAIEALDETEHEGRTIRVNEARPREPRSY
tara:strand:+ start:124 stop:516 length:393 start_codon:yes stop_codon:yes gene_type:complete